MGAQVQFQRVKEATGEKLALMVYDPDAEARSKRAVKLSVHCNPYPYDENWHDGKKLMLRLAPGAQKGRWDLRLNTTAQTLVKLYDESWSAQLSQADAREIADAVQVQKGMPIYFLRAPVPDFDPANRKQVALSLWVRDTSITLYRNEPIIDSAAGRLTLPGWFHSDLPHGWEVRSQDHQWEKNVLMVAPESLYPHSLLGTIEFQRRLPNMQGHTAKAFCEMEMQATARHAGIGEYHSVTIHADQVDKSRVSGVGIWQGPDHAGHPMYCELWFILRGGRGLVACYQGRLPHCTESELSEARRILGSLEFLF